MKITIKLFIIVLLLIQCSHEPIKVLEYTDGDFTIRSEPNEVHYVIIECNPHERDHYFEKLKSYRPKNIHLPDYYRELCPPKPWYPYVIYYDSLGRKRLKDLKSPSDTAGLEIISLSVPRYKPTPSVLEISSSAIKREHQLIFIEQFQNLSDAKKYIRQIRKKDYLLPGNDAFPFLKSNRRMLGTYFSQFKAFGQSL